MQSLMAAGVEVALLRKLRWYSIHNASDRSHVRVVVVDGRIGYTGGFGLASVISKIESVWATGLVTYSRCAFESRKIKFAPAPADATGEFGITMSESVLIAKTAPLVSSTYILALSDRATAHT